MKKAIFLVFILILLFGIAYIFFWLPSHNIKVLSVIPNNAAFVLASDKPVEAWETISDSDPWNYISRSTGLASLDSQVRNVNKFLSENDWLKLVGNNRTVISAHKIRNRFEYLFICDIGKISTIKTFNYYIENFLSEDYQLTYRKIGDTDVMEFYIKEEKSTFYLCFKDNLLISSFSPSLIERSLEKTVDFEIRDAYLEITDLMAYSGLIRFYIQHRYFVEYLNEYLYDKELFEFMAENLLFTGLAFDINDENLALSGYTNISDTANPYLEALSRSGMGGHDFLDILPENSPYFMALGFENMSEFVSNLESQMKVNRTDYEGYIENRHSLENFLKIDLDEDLISWVDDEIVLFQSSPANAIDSKNELAIALQIKDKDKAVAGLEHIQRQIKKKTPVKVDKIEYRGYEINYLAVKGFFKPFFGKLFSKFDKPYYAIINNWAVFASHPRALKNIIEHYNQSKTLVNLDGFDELYDELENESVFFLYANTQLVFDELKNISTEEQWKEIEMSKQYITAFPFCGFQLSSDENVLYTSLNTIFDRERKIDKTYNNVRKEENKQVSKDTPEVKWEDIYKSELDKVDDYLVDDPNKKMHEEFYSNGELHWKVHLKNGWKHGRFESFFENGKMQFQGRFKRDKKYGKWKIYNKKGDLIDKILMSN